MVDVTYVSGSTYVDNARHRLPRPHRRGVSVKPLRKCSSRRSCPTCSRRRATPTRGCGSARASCWGRSASTASRRCWPNPARSSRSSSCCWTTPTSLSWPQAATSSRRSAGASRARGGPPAPRPDRLETGVRARGDAQEVRPGDDSSSRLRVHRVDGADVGPGARGKVRTGPSSIRRVRPFVRGLSDRRSMKKGTLQKFIAADSCVSLSASTWAQDYARTSVLD